MRDGHAHAHAHAARRQSGNGGGGVRKRTAAGTPRTTGTGWVARARRTWRRRSGRRCSRPRASPGRQGAERTFILFYHWLSRGWGSMRMPVELGMGAWALAGRGVIYCNSTIAMFYLHEAVLVVPQIGQRKQHEASPDELGHLPARHSEIMIVDRQHSRQATPWFAETGRWGSRACMECAAHSRPFHALSSLECVRLSHLMEKATSSGKWYTSTQYVARLAPGGGTSKGYPVAIQQASPPPAASCCRRASISAISCCSAAGCGSTSSSSVSTHSLTGLAASMPATMLRARTRCAGWVLRPTFVHPPRPSRLLCSHVNTYAP